MLFFLSQQVSVFLMSIICGLILGVINELFRFLRYLAFRGKIENFVMDIIFMIISAFVTFFFALCYNRGYVRWFVLLGELCGFIVFRYSIGLLTRRIYSILAKVIRFITVHIKKFFTAIVTIFGKFIGFIMVKIPLLNKSEKTACNNSGFYCIMAKKMNLFKRAFLRGKL